jgi:ABC-type sugar transport system permease subunit
MQATDRQPARTLRLNPGRYRDNLAGYLFIAPALAVVGIFGIFPIFFTLYISLYRWRIRRGPFLGLGNYRAIFGSLSYLALFLGSGIALYAAARLLSAARPWLRRSGGLLLAATLGLLAWALPHMVSAGDTGMYDSLQVTVWYSLGTVPVQLVLGLLAAVLLYRRLPANQLFRVIYLLPYIVPTVASAAVFERIFSLRPQGLANQLLALFGAAPLQWLYEPRGIFEMLSGGRIPASAPGVVADYWLGWAQGPSLALFAIMLYNWWVFVGYYALIYINGLNNIPRHLYEAAQVDGANARVSFFRITIPLLSPTTYFLTLLGIIGTFKAFTQIYVLRNPAVGAEVDPMSVEIFFVFFGTARFGYAAAQALVLFFVVLLLTLLQRRFMEREVSYGE